MQQYATVLDWGTELLNTVALLGVQQFAGSVLYPRVRRNFRSDTYRTDAGMCDESWPCRVMDQKKGLGAFCSRGKLRQDTTLRECTQIRAWGNPGRNLFREMEGQYSEL